MLPRRVPSAEAIVRLIIRDIATKRDVVDHADVRIGECPALTRFVQKDYPQKVMLLRVVNNSVGPTSSFWGFKWQRRV
jgi:hypothetical protein